MNAVIIEDETAAVSTLKAILAQNSIIPVSYTHLRAHET